MKLDCKTINETGMGQIYKYSEGEKQNYSKYSDEDKKVWRLLYDHQLPQLPDSASDEFLRGLLRINFMDGNIPQFEDMNKRLKSFTGWEVVVVPGLIADDVFFNLLKNKKFPASTWVRKLSELDYLEEPDMFHDVFAHVPLLTNQSFVDYLQELSRIALKFISNPWAIEVLSRIYWFTVEFGLIEEKNITRIYGAGILSSKGETEYCLSDKAKRYPFNVSQIMHTDYRKDVFQSQYWIVNSYEQLFQSIPEIEKVLNEMVLEVKK